MHALAAAGTDQFKRFVYVTSFATQFAGNRSTTSAISSSVYILKPFSLVTLANCTFLASSFSSITCFSVFKTKVSASVMLRDCGEGQRGRLGGRCRRD